MTFAEFYADNLRVPMFTGFLSLGGFLFAAKTFIVVHMKKEVYDTEGYAKRLSEMRRLNSKLSHYQPLANLSALLFWSVSSSLLTATLQLTLGMIPKNWAAATCMSAAAVTIILLACCLVAIRRNIKCWLKDLEETVKAKAARSQATD